MDRQTDIQMTNALLGLLFEPKNQNRDQIQILFTEALIETAVENMAKLGKPSKQKA